MIRLRSVVWSVNSQQAEVLRQFCREIGIKVYEQTSKTVCNRTKAHTARWLCLNDVLAGVLLEHRKQTKFSDPSDHLIIDKVGKIICQWEVRRLHCRTCEREQIKKISIHDSGTPTRAIT